MACILLLFFFAMRYISIDKRSADIGRERSSMDHTRKTLSQLFWPVFIEYLLLMLVGVADTVMLSFVGDKAVSGVGTSNTYLYLVSMVFTIMSTGALTVMTQYIGAKHGEVAIQAKKLGLLFNAIIGGIFTLLFLLCSRPILHVLSTADAIFEEANTYMMMVGATCILLAVTNVYSSYLRAFGFARYTLISTAAGDIMNIVLNGIFIWMGWGVFGVSLATILSRILTLVLIISYSKRIQKDVPQGESRESNRKILSEIVRIGLPAAGELIVFNLSISFEMRCLNLMDAEGIAVGVYSYCNQICNLIYCAAVALSQANGIIVGWRVGERRFDESYRQTMTSVKWGTLVSGFTALLCAVITKPILSVLTDNAQILSLVTVVMVINVFKELGRAGNYIIGTALKSSGDATITVIMGICSMPICAVLGSYVLGLKLGYGVYGAWVGMALDECIRCTWMYLRLRSGKWEKKALAPNPVPA